MSGNAHVGYEISNWGQFQSMVCFEYQYNRAYTKVLFFYVYLNQIRRIIRCILAFFFARLKYISPINNASREYEAIKYTTQPHKVNYVVPHQSNNFSGIDIILEGVYY